MKLKFNHKAPKLYTALGISEKDNDKMIRDVHKLIFKYMHYSKEIEAIIKKYKKDNKRVLALTILGQWVNKLGDNSAIR